MLNKFMMRAAVTAAAFAGTTGAATAEEQHVLMMDYAFFPEVSYLEAGDVVVFENISGETRDVLSNNDTWGFTQIESGTSVTLQITEDMPTKYFSMVQGGAGDTVDEDGNVRVVGTMNFSGAPQIDED
ncbi:MAG: hypothetical protein ABJJ53_02150 [Sulfitobacter sp.]